MIVVDESLGDAGGNCWWPGGARERKMESSSSKLLQETLSLVLRHDNE
jgi:hypothetical protein